MLSNIGGILGTTVSFLAVVLFGWLIFENTKKTTDKALSENDEDKKKVEANDKQLADEQAKRDAIAEQLKKDKSNVTQEDIDKYFNNPDNK